MSISDKKRWTIQHKIAMIADRMHFKIKNQGASTAAGMEQLKYLLRLHILRDG